MKINQMFDEHILIIEKIKETYRKEIVEIIKVCQEALIGNKTIYFMGNGGSAADSQHLAAEFVGRFKQERKGMSAIALTTDTSVITAIGNDYGFDNIFKRQIEALIKKNDIIFSLSTSGNSNNVLNAVVTGKELGAKVIGLLGKDGGTIKNYCDVSVIVPSEDTARIQEVHILIGHIICEIIEEELKNAE
ncbi:D-sedoheptulose-7-phosphate isomerase [Halalkalibacterium ligniniphilum]|uniref:D-sedoheptulose-7-phosphate isomerase n=1 Tax=Halalkalibacterium ligniniphilum TaxID=1134413 RepID=UPI000348BF90|nr:SIS domain-containing protein [Halalkalibacterium ligniniphilum]